LQYFYHRNMLVINFYLNTHIFPVELEQYDKRLTATSWNLAYNPSGNIVGFSGTNDNHRILPLQVSQFFPSNTGSADSTIEDLFATNGFMLDAIMKNTVNVSELKDKNDRSISLISALEGRMTQTSEQLHAIIDCGAILAGTNLREFSRSLLNEFKDDSFGGVLYYDDHYLNDWVILEKSGRCLPLKTFLLFEMKMHL